ncbi:hypothetical protein BD560DRAFT_397134 [Blakeslea trispora]|nr:hypothetical protein BD560DRAFT_397134 [Blakeslea trispora]
MLRLTWNEMPPYCRYCQKDNHCNDLGNISKDRPRREHGSQIPPNKRVTITRLKWKRKLL